MAHRWAYSIYRYAASVRPSSVRPSTFSNDISSEAVRPVIYILKKKWILYISGEADSFHIPNIASIGSWNEKLCFLFRSDRTLVAMATYSSHRLIMGKVEICKKKSVSMEIFGFFYRNVYWVVLYVSYNFCPNRYFWLVVGAAKRVNFRKNV